MLGTILGTLDGIARRWYIIMVYCMALIKASNWDLMMVNCLALYL